MSEQAEKGEWPSTTLPESWSWASFQDAWSDSTDSTRKLKQKEYLAEGPLPVVDQGESLVGGFTDRHDLKNDVALPCIVFGDHTRAVKFIDFEFAQGADGVKVLQPNDQYDPEFAYHALLCVRLPNKGYSRHFKFLRSTAFPIPPLPEQRRIVAKLDRLSARSAAARDHLARTTKLATRAKQAVLDAAFTSLSDSGCDTVAFSEIVEHSQNGISKRRGDSGEDTLVLRLADLTDGRFIGRDGRAIRLTEQEREKYLLEEGDLVCIRVNGSENLVGRMLRWNTPEYWCFCDHFIRFRLREDMASSDFVSWFFATDAVRRGIESSFVSSAGQKTVSQKTLGKFALPLPSLQQQTEIVRRIEAAFARIDRLTEEASRAAHLLDRLDERLLAKAFRGELVPQDPEDEPAEALLTRIREARAAAPRTKRSRKHSASIAKTT